MPMNRSCSLLSVALSFIDFFLMCHQKFIFVINVVQVSFTLSLLFIYNLIESVLLLLIPRKFRGKKDITGQKVLITGAGSGLGRQLAIELSRYSTCLVLLDINKISLQETVKLLDSRSSVFIYECDISDRKLVYKVADDIKKDVGDVDILINNAGIVNGHDFLDISDEKIIKTIEVNTLAHFWMCKAFLPDMIEKNSGHIICVSSMAGLVGAMKLTDYSASKFASAGFAEALELELRTKHLDGIKVTVVYPSHINTGLFDGMNITVSPPLSPNFVAKEIVWGIQKELETIIIPFYLNFSRLKMLLPRWLIYKFLEYSGNFFIMNNFKGRGSNNNINIIP